MLFGGLEHLLEPGEVEGNHCLPHFADQMRAVADVIVTGRPGFSAEGEDKPYDVADDGGGAGGRLHLVLE